MKRKERVTSGRGQGGRVGKKEKRRHCEKGWRAGTPGHSTPGTLPGRLTCKAQSKPWHLADISLPASGKRISRCLSLLQVAQR